jgi:hypothetical protein
MSKDFSREVVADPCTYTLGDPTGPLVVLRVPDKAALPREKRWEGDLPGTTLALTPEADQVDEGRPAGALPHPATARFHL